MVGFSLLPAWKSSRPLIENMLLILIKGRILLTAIGAVVSLKLTKGTERMTGMMSLRVLSLANLYSMPLISLMASILSFNISLRVALSCLLVVFGAGGKGSLGEGEQME